MATRNTTIGRNSRFGAEYNRYAEFNNYQNYYLRFQHNNFDIGVQITFPIFDASRRAKARESAADAARAGAEADQTKFQTSEQVYSLRHSIKRACGSRTDRRAKEPAGARATGFDSSTATEWQRLSECCSPVSPKDEQQALIQERERYQDALDATFSMIRVELSLMRSLGQIEDWVHWAAAK